MPRIFLMLGAINAFLCVAFGAFGAHGLKQSLSAEMLTVYQTGVQYHFSSFTNLYGQFKSRGLSGLEQEENEGMW